LRRVICFVVWYVVVIVDRARLLRCCLLYCSYVVLRFVALIYCCLDMFGDSVVVVVVVGDVGDDICIPTFVMQHCVVRYCYPRLTDLLLVFVTEWLGCCVVVGGLLLPLITPLRC